jgi:hypothetical protein
MANLPHQLGLHHLHPASFTWSAYLVGVCFSTTFAEQTEPGSFNSESLQIILGDLRSSDRHSFWYYRSLLVPYLRRLVNTTVTHFVTQSVIVTGSSMGFDAMNFFVHANNSVLMMIDLFVVAHPIRLLHCCYPIVFGICYAVFSVIYYAAGGISK